MDFVTAREAATLWGISQHRVAVLCPKDRVRGVKFLENMWLLPQGAQKPNYVRSLRFQPKTLVTAKPFIKWAGGKTQILNSIRLKYPTGLGVTVTKYAEPFVGGGAVLFDILSNYNLEQIYVSDINRELIFTYKTIRDNIDALLAHLTVIEKEYLLADENTFVYFDPPYRPLTVSSSFTSYSQDSFGDKEQIELARFIDILSERGAYVMASNSDPKNYDESDNFFVRLYEKHEIMQIDTNRTVNPIHGRKRFKTWIISNEWHQYDRNNNKSVL